jgi:membrane protease YdiL (CAAX protease family)
MPLVAWVLVASPPIVSLSERLFSTGDSSSPVLWLLLALINGTLEEVLWRGIAATLFPVTFLWGVLWPTAWFAIWHLAPGMLSMPSQAWQLVAGSAFLGFALGWVAQRTRSIFWPVLSHALAGIAQA